MFSVRKKRQPPPMTNARMAVIFVIVAGCFLVLVPSIFFPITKSGFKYLFGMVNNDQDENSEFFLPRKVEMAMKNSPKRDSGSTRKLSGRPQFYTGANMEKMYSKMGPLAPSTQMEQQIGIPTVIITFVVAYILIKVLLNSSQEDDINETPGKNANSSCPECSNGMNSCKCERQSRKQDPVYRREAKRRDLIQSRPTYRAFDCYGEQAVNESISGLLQNMETFRDYLRKAQACKCKLDKYKRIHEEMLKNKRNADNAAAVDEDHKESVESAHHKETIDEGEEDTSVSLDKNNIVLKSEDNLHEVNDSTNGEHDIGMNNQQTPNKHFEMSLLTENNLQSPNIDDEMEIEKKRNDEKDADSVLPDIASNQSTEIDHNDDGDDAKENVETSVHKPQKRNARKRRRPNKNNKTKLDCLAK